MVSKKEDQRQERSLLLSPAAQDSESREDSHEIDFSFDDVPIATTHATLHSPRVRVGAKSPGVKVDDPSFEEEKLEPDDPSIRPEIHKMLTLMTPIILTTALEFIPGFVCIVQVGHLDSPYTKEFVDAATFSTTLTNVTGLSIVFGLSSALDTLCSQAFGAKQYMKNGIYLQAGLLIVVAFMGPVFLINWNADVILAFLGLDPQVSAFAGEFSRYTVFGVPFLFVYELFRKVLLGQNVVKPMMYIALMGNFVNIFGGYYLTYYTPLGFHGAALARTLGYVAMPLLMFLYLGYTGVHKQWWPGWKLDVARTYMPLYLSLGLPSCALVCMDWWAYEILAILAGLLPDGVIAMSAHAVLMNLAQGMYVVYMGTSVAANIRVGNCLGANHPKRAQMASSISMAMALGSSIIGAAVVYFCRHLIPLILINDPVTVQRAAETMLVMVPYQVADSINGVIQGIYRGVGWQLTGAKINAFSYYILGLPLGCLLGFYFDMNLEGLWIGFLLGHVAAFLCCAFFLYRCSWKELAEEAQTRTAH